MLKVIKYLFLAKIFKKANKNILAVIVSMFLIVFTSMLMNDLVDVSSGIYSYLFILFKWMFNVCFLAILVHNLIKLLAVLNESISLRTTKDKDPVSEAKRERVLNKECLATKSERIVQKYMKEVL